MMFIAGARRLHSSLLGTSAVALLAIAPAVSAQETPAPVAPAAAVAAPEANPSAVKAAASPADVAAAAPAQGVEPAAAPGTGPAPLENLAPGETPASVAAEPPPPPAAKVTEAPKDMAPVTDPVELAVRDRLTKPLAGVDKADTAALVAFYAARTEGAVWIKDGAFNGPAQLVLTTFKNAEDWGLEAKNYPVPSIAAGADTAALADAELKLSAAALKYARHASGGQVDPSTLSRFNDFRGTFAEPSAVLSGLAATTKPDVYLEALHPQHPQFQKLHEALVKILHPAAGKAEEAAAPEAPKLVLAPGASIKPGAKNDEVAAIREFLKIPAETGKEAVYSKDLVAAVKAFQEEHGLQANGVITNATRTAFGGGDLKKKTAQADPAKLADKIALNMERWRWMPTDMGKFHVLNNIPEYTTRAFKDGEMIYQEKIIVGKSNTPTSLFSANMQFVIFHPEWGVPDSIKVKELLPYLRRKTQSDDFFGLGPAVSDTRILQRQNLRVSYNGKPVDASKIDWTRVDPRAYQFIQPAGGTNALGLVKFRFPNRHDIYMHDTPQRGLFSETTRAFSHGCMRVNNPKRFAEVILAEDRGWSADKVSTMMAGSATQEVKIERPFPVHSAYFTVRVDENGKVNSFPDLYGHDAKLTAALNGKPVKLEDPSVTSGDTSFIAAQAAQKKKGGAQGSGGNNQASLGDLLSGLFGN